MLKKEGEADSGDFLVLLKHVTVNVVDNDWALKATPVVSSKEQPIWSDKIQLTGFAPTSSPVAAADPSNGHTVYCICNTSSGGFPFQGALPFAEEGHGLPDGFHFPYGVFHLASLVVCTGRRLYHHHTSVVVEVRM